MNASREAVATSGAETDPVARIEQSLIDLVRRATDPRGNATLKSKSGIDLERAESALLGRVGELGPARLSDVAAAAGVDISTASRPVARLVERGYVERSTDPADGRACLLQCTPVGLEVLARQRAARREWLVEIMETFSPKERERFAELFDRFVTAVLATA